MGEVVLLMRPPASAMEFDRCAQAMGGVSAGCACRANINRGFGHGVLLHHSAAECPGSGSGVWAFE